MKLPNSKIYWSDYLSYASMLTPEEICEVLKIIACRAMCYNLPDNPPDNRSDNPPDNLPVCIQRQRQIQKLNKIQREFYLCMEKAQDESARDYLSKINNGKKGGRPKKEPKTEVKNNCLSLSEEKMVEIERGKFFMDESMPEYKDLLDGLSYDEVEKLWKWILAKYEYQKLPVSKIQTMIKNFNKKVA